MRQSILGRRKRGSASPLEESPSKAKEAVRTGPYDRAFHQHLVDHSVYPDLYEYPDGQVPPEPENIDEIRRALAQRRPSLSPSRFSEEHFRRFARANARASKEREVTTTVIPMIEGNVGDRSCVAGDVSFGNLAPLTDGTLVPGNPDLYYGARPEQLDKRVRFELDSFIVPSTQHDLPAAPNFSLAVKDPDGSLAVAERQACYNGALQARGIQHLLSFGRPFTVYDNKAHTVMCVYHGGVLRIYTSHLIRSRVSGAGSQYGVTQVKVYAVTSDSDEFRRGAAAFRNARDWAKLQRDEAIKQENEKVARRGFAAEESADQTAVGHTRQDT